MPSSKSSLDKRDVYYRKGKSDGYRARSAYKLLHLDEEYDLFTGVNTAVDLCAAPGSWSQVLAAHLKPGRAGSDSRIVSIDLQPMAPLTGVTTMQTDITSPDTVPRVLEALGGRKADLVVCDGAPDVTGVHDLDAHLHAQLILAALTLSLTLMAPHATLIFKIFLSPLDPQAAVLRSQLSTFFPGPPPGQNLDDGDEDDMAGKPGYDRMGRRGGVWVRKPRSSRKGSGEAFIVCRNFDPTTVPLPTAISPQVFESFKRDIGSTLTLETLSALSSNGGIDPSWTERKRYVGGGDLNGNAPASGMHLPLPSHRRDSSLKSLDEIPSPIDTRGSFLSSSPIREHLSEFEDFRRGVNMFRPVSPAPSDSWAEFQGLRSASGTPVASSLDSDGSAAGSSMTPVRNKALDATPVSNSKTDAFFSTSVAPILPTPPSPLPKSASSTSPTITTSPPPLPLPAAPRTPALGRGMPPSMRARVVTTPNAPLTLDTNHLIPPVSPTNTQGFRSVTNPRFDLLNPPSPKSLLPRGNGPIAISRETHHDDPDAVPIKEGDVLVPSTDGTALPIRVPANPGKWTLVEPLGEGAFSIVWSAVRENDNRNGAVAVKMIDRSACVRNSRTTIAFCREVEVLRHLVHPGIVSYITHFSTDSHHCLVLEKLDGGELFHVVEDQGLHKRMLQPGPNDPTGEGLVRRIFGELCRAVAWLHEVEVVHRDIKLENILFTVNPFLLPATSTGAVPLDQLPSPLIKLSDFGLSRFIANDSPLLSTRCGSEAYAAPEVVMGNLYDGRRTDAWALGVVLYALVAGELPFDDNSVVSGGRPRAGSTTSTVSSTGGDQAMADRLSRRRVMHHIAKGEYGWREGVGSAGVREVVARLLTRDTQRRARVSRLWELEWMSAGPGAVPPPQEPMVEPLPPRAPTPHVVVDQGVLVDHQGIGDLARTELTEHM